MMCNSRAVAHLSLSFYINKKVLQSGISQCNIKNVPLGGDIVCALIFPLSFVKKKKKKDPVSNRCKVCQHWLDHKSVMTC